MRKFGIALLLGSATAGCNDERQAEAAARADANLLDAAAVNAILDSGPSPEERPPENDIAGNASGELENKT